MSAESIPTRSTVPFLDLRPSHDSLKASILDDIAELIDRGDFANGRAVHAFEEAFADYCGTSRCVGVASGLDALRLGLLAAEVGPGDEVIVPANTFIATFEAVTQAGSRPVPVDATEDDYNLDVAAATAAVTARTRAVIPVHLYGQLAHMGAVTELARARELVVLEDACQAHGATRDGFRAGASGHAAAFSFYPSKNLGAFGDGGAITTDDATLTQRARALREHGQTERHRHDLEGYTSRLDTIQALVLLRKLACLERWNEERRRIASVYHEGLAGVGDLRLPPIAAGSRPVWHLFVVRTDSVDELHRFLAERGIQVGRHYPRPPHLSPAFEWLGYGRGSFPVTEALAEQLISLPLFPGISEEQLATVIEAVQSFFAGRGGMAETPLSTGNPAAVSSTSGGGRSSSDCR